MVSKSTTRKELLRLLKKTCQKINNGYVQDYPRTLFDIKKAALFPYAKEMHSLIRYADMLPFSIEKVYDTRFSMYTGATTKHLLNDSCM